MIRERNYGALPGLPMLLLFLAVVILCVLGIIRAATGRRR